jgi:CoA-transferase family III
VSPIQPVLDRLSSEIATLSGRLGRRVEVAGLGVLDRAGHLPLAEPGRISCNAACRMIQASDGWIAINLAREEDRELVPAWLEADVGVDPWAQIERRAPAMTCATLIERAILLDLPAARVGEVAAPCADAVNFRMSHRVAPSGAQPRVLDLSALWAGPLCGAILAAAGAQVTRIESLGRPDPTRTATPEFFRRLNGGKAEMGLDLRRETDRRRLVDLARTADILITGARPAALARLSLTPATLFDANPRMIWVAITGYGWNPSSPAGGGGPRSGGGGFIPDAGGLNPLSPFGTAPPEGEHLAPSRVAFGDDASAAGGMVGWTADGGPQFLGDALADPITGLAAAAGALAALEAGGGVMVDAALAVSAAGAAHELGLLRTR